MKCSCYSDVMLILSDALFLYKDMQKCAIPEMVALLQAKHKAIEDIAKKLKMVLAPRDSNQIINCPFCRGTGAVNFGDTCVPLICLQCNGTKHLMLDPKSKTWRSHEVN